MTQQNVLRVCRWLGYLSLCLFLCSWIPGCGGGGADVPTEKEAEPEQVEPTQKTESKSDAQPAVAEVVPDPNVEATPNNVAPPSERKGDDTLALANADETPTPTTAKSGFSKFDMLMAALSIFVLSIFVGFEVITKVPPTLHTPLMSGSNAISGITLVGALLVAGRGDYAAWLGVLAVVFATINVIGGFWVTHRMLSMFQKR